MKLRSYCLDFVTQNGIVFPFQPLLHKLTIQFIENELSGSINLADFRKVLIVCETDENEVPTRVQAIACEQLRSDWPVLRFVENQAGEMLFQRMRGYLQDAGLSGSVTFVHVANHEPKESRCPKWRSWLRKMGAVKASRWAVKV